VSGFGPPPGPPSAPVRVRRASYLAPTGPAIGAPGSAAASRGRYALTRSAKPGIVPLAPLRLGDLIEGSVKHVRRNPGPVLGAAAVVNSLAAIPVVVLIALAFAGSWLRTTRVSTVLAGSAVPPLLGLAGTALATFVLSGLLAYAVAEATLGRRHPLPAIWAVARPRIWTVLGTQALTCLSGLLPWAVVIGALALVSDGPVPLVLLVGAGGGLAALAADVWLVPRLIYAAPAAVLERLTAGRALARAWALSRGRTWSIVGVLLIVLSLAVIVFWALELPQLGLYHLLIDVLEVPRGLRDPAGDVAFALANLGAAVVVTPFVATSIVLHYLDARMRREGLDLALLRAAATDAGARP